MIWSATTLLMFSFFVGLCLLMAWPSAKRAYDKARYLPLREEQDQLISPRRKP